LFNIGGAIPAPTSLTLLGLGLPGTDMTRQWRRPESGSAA